MAPGLNFGFTIIDTMEESLGLAASSQHGWATMVSAALDDAAGGDAARRAQMSLIEPELEATLYHAARCIARDSEPIRVTVTFHGSRISVDAAQP